MLEGSQARSLQGRAGPPVRASCVQTQVDQLAQLLHNRSARVLLNACVCLFAMAGTHPRWTGELQQLSPSSLVQLLTASDTRLLRLQFLAEKERQEKVPLYNSVVNLSDAKFVERYPGYTAWVAAHKHKASASV